MTDPRVMRPSLSLSLSPSPPPAPAHSLHKPSGCWLGANIASISQKKLSFIVHVTLNLQNYIAKKEHKFKLLTLYFMLILRYQPYHLRNFD